MKTYDKIIEGKPVFLDGSMGAIIMSHGIMPSKILASNIEAPELISDIHKGYIDAGSDIILTNTFDMTEVSVTKSGYTTEEIISAAVKCAQKASKGKADIAFDVSPSGYLLNNKKKDLHKEIYTHYKKLLTAAVNEVDLVLIESISLLEDIEAFCEAASDVGNIPIFASMTINEKRTSWFGCSLDSWIKKADSLGLTAAGLNCTLSPKEMLPLVSEMKASLKTPVFAKPNKGQPVTTSGKALYNMTTEEFADGMLDIYKAGINIIGGCCGSDKDCITEMKRLVCNYEKRYNI